jgi:hypothetical protein
MDRYEMLFIQLNNKDWFKYTLLQLLFVKVIIEDYIEKRYLIPFNISREQVNDATHHDDVKRTIKYGNCTIILFLKKFGRYYLLVDGRWDSSFSLKISNVFIIDEQLIKGLSLENPLAILVQFANEFGYEIRIGNQSGKFIQDAEIEIPYREDMGDIEKAIMDNILISYNGSSKPRPYLGDMLTNFNRHGGKLHIDFALVYFISVDKYDQYLKRNNLP